MASGPGDVQSVEPWTEFRTEVDDGARYFFPSGMIGKTSIMQTKSGHMLQFGDALDHSGVASIDLANGQTASTLSHTSFVGLSNPAYRWNLIRDTDATGNSTIYVWDTQAELFTSSSSILPNKLHYLTDIYDTSSQAPNLDLTALPPPQAQRVRHHTHLNMTLAQYPNTDPIGGFPIPYASSAIWRRCHTLSCPPST